MRGKYFFIKHLTKPVSCGIIIERSEKYPGIKVNNVSIIDTAHAKVAELV